MVKKVGDAVSWDDLYTRTQYYKLSTGYYGEYCNLHINERTVNPGNQKLLELYTWEDCPYCEKGRDHAGW